MQEITLEPYLYVWQKTQELKGLERGAPLEEIIDLLSDVARDLRQDDGNEVRAGFRLFGEVQTLAEGFETLAEELDDYLEHAEEKSEQELASKIPIKWKQRRQMLELVSRFEAEFRSEIGRRRMFVSPENTALLQYLSPQKWADRGEQPESEFDHLPRVAQAYFEDAGRCLAYGLPGATVGLALQATEATLRFYYNRHSGAVERVETDWGPMLKWLKDKKHLPVRLDMDPERSRDDPQDYCYQVLDKLRGHYRNAVAHGRANFESGRQAASENEAERVLQECWNAARMLIAEAGRRKQLTLQIIVHPDLDLDIVVATYLYWWNPEMPPFRLEQIAKDQSIAPATIVDSTLDPAVQLQRSPDRCLSSHVRCHLRLQYSYERTLDPLIDFVSGVYSGSFHSRFDPNTPREVDVTLVDLFNGIRRLAKNHFETVLTNTWSMLDQFMQSNLSPTGPHLITELQQQPAYEALCGRE